MKLVNAMRNTHPLLGRTAILLDNEGTVLWQIVHIETLYEPLWLSTFDSTRNTNVMALSGSKIQTYVTLLHDDGRLCQKPIERVLVTNTPRAPVEKEE